MERERIFTVEATPVKFGPGAAAEAGWEAARLGLRRGLLVTDPGLVRARHAQRVQASLEAEGIEVVVFDRVRIEPSLESLQEAVDVARDVKPDGYVSVGGGSVIDTAKVANLVVGDGGEILDYVNPPVGEGRAPGGPLAPHIAVPTTGGTGSEATTVAVLDLPELRLKTGISHRYLRPSQAIVDPQMTGSLPAPVVAATGLDVICHAAESYISRPFDSRPRPASPGERPPYQGSNPVADLWSARALEYGGRYLRRAVEDPLDLEARGAMMLAATLAGIGFGSAGVHIPHACAYPIAGLRHDYRPAGYPDDHGFVPHGLSVIVTAPASFRFTYRAAPERHIEVAEMLTGTTVRDPSPETLPTVLVNLMRELSVPTSLREFGYTETDLPELIAGALKQQRLLAIAPRPVEGTDLEQILLSALGH